MRIAVIGAGAVGVAYIGGQVEAPGVIRHIGTTARLVFGPAARAGVTPRRRGPAR